ncbi:MAG: hypothetical protein ACYCZY_07895, partial [Lacisediminihabitans sp.]
ALFTPHVDRLTVVVEHRRRTSRGDGSAGADNPLDGFDGNRVGLPLDSPGPRRVRRFFSVTSTHTAVAPFPSRRSALSSAPRLMSSTNASAAIR